MHQQRPRVKAFWYDNGDSRTGSVEPKLPCNFTFTCSEPGYERIRMPYLLAMYEIHLQHDVLFQSQNYRCLSLWQFITSMLERAWDHDDAFECTPEQVPIKILVERYRSYAGAQRPAHDENPARHAVSTSVLRRECKRYFDEHAGLSFENEDLVRLLRRVEATLEPESLPADEDDLVGEWYALYGFEVARWLLLGTTIALGFNFSTGKALPERFEVLRQNPKCYIS